MEEGRTAVITGASKGIGAAAAIALSRRGFSVCINYLQDRKGAEDTLSHCLISEDNFLWKADVSSPGETGEMFHECRRRWGRVDVLVNNAGIYRRVALEDMDYSSWRKTLMCNLDSVFLCTREVLPMMKQAGYGRIINISSQLALKGSRHGADYAASKAGIIGFTRSCAIELAKYGITVNAIAPGFINTAILGVYDKEQRANMAAQIPAGRIGNAEDVSAAIVFLASEEASYINGAMISVSGGSFLH